MILVDTKTREAGRTAVEVKGNLLRLKTDLVILLSTFLNDKELEAVLEDALEISRNPETQKMIKDEFFRKDNEDFQEEEDGEE